MSPPEEPTLSEDIRQRKNKNMEDSAAPKTYAYMEKILADDWSC